MSVMVVFMKMLVIPALFVHGADVHPADLPIRHIHLFTRPVDFPITPTQPHTLLAVIRPTCSARLTAAHRCAYCVRSAGLMLIMYSYHTSAGNQSG